MRDPIITEASPKAGLKAIRILCLALVFGALLFAIVIIVLTLLNGPAMPGEGQEFKMILMAVVAGIALLCSTQAIRIYKRGITDIRNSIEPLNNKLNQYRDLLIKYMALCEGSALFSIIIFFMLGDYLFLIITGVLLLMMLIRLPQKRKMASELGLNYQEQQELE